MGHRMVQKQTVICRGQDFTNYVMVKPLEKASITC
jgi:hypothetical protein